MHRSGERKYDILYYVEWFSGSMPPRRAIFHARTLHGAKKETVRRFQLRAFGDMLRICVGDELLDEAGMDIRQRFGGKGSDTIGMVPSGQQPLASAG